MSNIVILKKKYVTCDKKYIRMKKISFLLFGFFFASVLQAQVAIDTMAVYVLKQTANHIQACSTLQFKSFVNDDMMQEQLGVVTYSHADEIFIKHPDKLKFKSTGDRGIYSLFLNGKDFKWYSLKNNTYVGVSAKHSMIEMIKEMHERYNIEVSGSDFLYPSFAEDVISSSQKLVYLGIGFVNQIACFHIAGTDDAGSSFQFWISSDGLFLPVKLSINYPATSDQVRYEAIYSDWEINPNLPDILFEFTPPPGAQQIQIKEMNKK